MFVENRTLFRKCPRGVLFFSTWRQSTAMQTAVDSQVWLRVEKVGGFMEQWKDQLQDTIRH